jgi:hypothetical protein
MTLSQWILTAGSFAPQSESVSNVEVEGKPREVSVSPDQGA